MSGKPEMRPMSEAPTDGTWIELWHEGCRYSGGPILGDDGEPAEFAGWVKGRAYAKGGDGDHYWECPEVDDDYTICFDGWRPLPSED